MKIIKIIVDENEKEYLTNLLKDLTFLSNLAERIRDKNDREIEMIKYIKSLINILSKILTGNTINRNECDKIEEFYRFHTIEVQRGNKGSAYEIEENKILKSIVNKINKSSTKL